MKFELLQFPRRRVQYVGRNLRAVRSALKVTDTDLEMAGGFLPHTPKRMVLADNQQATGLQDANGFPVVAREIGNPYCHVAPGIDEVVRLILQSRQINNISTQKVDLKAEPGSAVACNIELWL